MLGLDWGKILTVIISCAIKPGMAGIPAAVFLFKFTFLETLIICTIGGFIGIITFTFLIGGIIKLVNRVFDRHFPNRNKNKKIFTKKTRFILKAKKNFGIVGVAAITPIFLSFPLGIFLSLRFFGDRKRTIIWMMVFTIFWTIVLYFVFHFFHKSLEPYFAN